MVFDFLCLQLCFVLSYWLNVGFDLPYDDSRYAYQVLVLALSQAVVMLFTGNYQGIVRRGPFVELVSVLKMALEILVLALLYLFLVHTTADASRLLTGFTFAFYVVIDFAVRQLNKQRIRNSGVERKKSLALITSKLLVADAMERLEGGEGFRDYFISGIVILDPEAPGEVGEYGIPVVPVGRAALEKMSRGWVDEVLIIQPYEMTLPSGLLDDLLAMGVTVDWSPAALSDGRWPATDVREIGGYKAVTSGMRIPTTGELALKRLGDIAGGAVGCLMTCVLFVFVAPAIYIASPGPIFYSQERVGRNGRIFRMHKFRSMYLDADERKTELTQLNKVSDGMMFKVEGDPRIIGSEKRRSDGSPGGIGNFIRRTSIDEFPQFFNVLKGEMSLVGTRPPTLDEWDRYDLAHRARMSAKPGITGMWQVSGRSQITDFEEVVRLDREYIENWSALLDVKILLKTVVVVLRRKGAE